MTNDRYQLLELALSELRHPARLRILTVLAEGPASPNALTNGSGAKLGTVAYHVRAMADANLIKLTGERRVRGAVEHFYALTPAGRRLLRKLGVADG